MKQFNKKKSQKGGIFIGDGRLIGSFLYWIRQYETVGRYAGRIFGNFKVYKK